MPNVMAVVFVAPSRLARFRVYFYCNGAARAKRCYGQRDRSATCAACWRIHHSIFDFYRTFLHPGFDGVFGAGLPQVLGVIVRLRFERLTII